MYCVSCGRYSLAPLCLNCVTYGSGGGDPNMFDRKTGKRLPKKEKDKE